jgi:hypothetical protein
VLNVKLLLDTFVPNTVLKPLYGFLGLPPRNPTLPTHGHTNTSSSLGKQRGGTRRYRPHQALARLTGEVAFVHVATGWAARNFDQLN